MVMRISKKHTPMPTLTKTLYLLGIFLALRDRGEGGILAK